MPMTHSTRAGSSSFTPSPVLADTDNTCSRDMQPEQLVCMAILTHQIGAGSGANNSSFLGTIAVSMTGQGTRTIRCRCMPVSCWQDQSGEQTSGICLPCGTCHWCVPALLCCVCMPAGAARQRGTRVRRAHLVGVHIEGGRHLCCYSGWVCRGQVHLVEDRHQGQVLLKGQEEVGHSLVQGREQQEREAGMISRKHGGQS
jgi:hypothetical protein